MHKKEVNALFEDDFEDFIKAINRYDEFLDHKLTCQVCGTIINGKNVAFIYKREDYIFICDNQTCMEIMEG